MIHLTLGLPLNTGAAAKAGSVPAAASLGDAAASFGAILTKGISAAQGATLRPNAQSASAAANATPSDAETKIAALFAGGASQAEIVDTLAAQLAASVSEKLGTTTSDAREKLHALFSAALAPPGEEESATGSVPERARSLAARLERVTDLAERLLGTNGQQNRIAGHVLDARRAKDIPARNIRSTATASTSDRRERVAPQTATTTVWAPQGTASSEAAASSAAAASAAEVATTAGTTAAVATANPRAATDTTSDAAAHDRSVSAAGPTSHVSTAHRAPALAAAEPVAPGPHAASSGSLAGNAAATPAAPAATPTNDATNASLAAPVATDAGDGRSVSLDTRVAIATGGDTGLGRTLARAMLADDARRMTAVDTFVATPSATAKPAKTEPASTDSSKVARSQTPSAPVATKGSDDLVHFTRALTAALAEAAPEPNASAGTGTSAHDAAAPDAAGTASRDENGVPAGAAVAPVAAERSTANTASSAATATSSTVDHSAIADQVLRAISLRSTESSSEIRLTLVPQTLGDVNVKLVVTAGTVTAHVVAQTPEVRDALIAAQPQLSKAMTDAGLKLTAFSVDVAGNGLTDSSQQRSDERWRERQNARRTSTSTTADDRSVESVASNATPPTGRRIGAYNYLV